MLQFVKFHEIVFRFYIIVFTCMNIKKLIIMHIYIRNSFLFNVNDQHTFIIFYTNSSIVGNIWKWRGF